MKMVLATDVLLNVARQEGEAAKPAEELLRAIQTQRAEGATSAISLLEGKWAFYQRGEYALGDRFAQLVTELLPIAPVSAEIAEQAVELASRRQTHLFEAIHAVSAALSRGVLVTRDEVIRRKLGDVVPVLTPEEALFRLR